MFSSLVIYPIYFPQIPETLFRIARRRSMLDSRITQAMEMQFCVGDLRLELCRFHVQTLQVSKGMPSLLSFTRP